MHASYPFIHPPPTPQPPPQGLSWLCYLFNRASLAPFEAPPKHQSGGVDSEPWRAGHTGQMCAEMADVFESKLYIRTATVEEMTEQQTKVYKHLLKFLHC